METIELVVLGASALPEILEIIFDINAESDACVHYEVLAALDDNPAFHHGSIEGVPIYGELSRWQRFAQAKFVMGIGSYRSRLIRHEILKRLSIPRERFVTLVHPSAKVYRSTSLGCGCIIWAGAVLANNSRVDDFVIVLANTVVGANNHICEGAMLASLVVTTSHVTIGHYCHIGAATAIVENVKIGPGSQVVMGSLVARDVPAGVICGGKPSRIVDDTVEVPQILMEAWAQIISASA